MDPESPQNRPEGQPRGGEQRVPTADEPASHSERDGLLRDVPDVMDLGLKRNLFQASTVLISCAAGAGAGYLLIKEEPWAGAAVGGFLGLIAGAFVSGLILMLLPGRRISIEAARLKCWRLERRAAKSFMALLCVGLLGAVVLPVFAHDDRPWAFLICIGWACLFVGTAVYGAGLAGQVKQLKQSIEEARKW
jgi:hypothetical protein